MGTKIQRPDLGLKRKSSHKIFHENLVDEEPAKIGVPWYQMFEDYNTSGELVEFKDSELQVFSNQCQSAFEKMDPVFAKDNPSDAKWLMTALHKGTSKDRANSGALLVQTNPVNNLSALEALIGLTKLSNKTCADVIDVVAELFLSTLLPPNRKLLSYTLRGADWKNIKKLEDLPESEKSKILAYWKFENDLKEHYSEFLRNLQASIQSTNESNKGRAIVCTSKLLTGAPEKEHLLLSILVNKFGDPIPKVSSKALHHLTEVAYKHPNMCGVMVKETEKLLFRNNVSEHAQHIALCFLGQIAPQGNVKVCSSMVQICFSFFKVVVEKGAVNTRMMQAILRCLRRVIMDADANQDVMSKELQDTMYRLVHLADIHISIQTLSLLLQTLLLKSGSHDRFYNALYKKILDHELWNIGSKSASMFLHIIHRAVHMDSKVSRALAFIKRLLQLSLYIPTHLTCGILIIVNKLFKFRNELVHIKKERIEEEEVTKKTESVNLQTDIKFDDDSDDEEHYEDADEDEKNEGEDSQKNVNSKLDKKSKNDSSWHHKNLKIDAEESLPQAFAEENIIPVEKSKKKYDPIHRVPEYSNADNELRFELLSLANHFHPTVQVFATSIMENKPIGYYGDPLRDFTLTQFLERFAFKNPKKISEEETSKKTLTQLIQHKDYRPARGRAVSVKELTEDNCTEDERFLLNYIETKRAKRALIKKEKSDVDDDDDMSETSSVGDDDFDDYLNSLGGKGKDDDEEDVDFMKELQEDLQSNLKSSGKKDKKKKKSNEEENVEDAHWDDDNDEDEEDDSDVDGLNDEFEGEDMGGDSDGSVSLDGGDDEDDGDDDINLSDLEDDDGEVYVPTDEDEDDDRPRNKKRKIGNNSDFMKKLNGKSKGDIESLFAAAEDFSEILDDAGKSKGHGTLGEIFNRNKDSEKQLAWERSRLKGAKTYYSKNKRFSKKGNSSNNKKGGKKPFKKR